MGDTQSVFTKATATNMIWSHRRAAGDKWDNSGLSSGTDQASVDSRQGAADELSNHLSLVRASPREKDDADKTWQSRGPTKLCMRTSLGVRRLRKVINGMVKFINNAVPFAATLTKIFQALNAA